MALTQDRQETGREPRLGRGPAPSPHEGVAATLRQAREATGRDIGSVAELLRIRPSYLEAIESGDFTDLPGTAYAIGFVRSYAEYLDLNATQIVDRFKEEIQCAETRTELVFPEPVAESKIPSGAIVLISAALLVVAYGGWFYMSNQGQTPGGLIPALPDRLKTLVASDETGAPDAEETVAEQIALPSLQDGETPSTQPAPIDLAPAELAVAPPAAETDAVVDRDAVPETEVAEVETDPMPAAVEPDPVQHVSETPAEQPTDGDETTSEPVTARAEPEPEVASVTVEAPPPAPAPVPDQEPAFVTETEDTLVEPVSSGLQAQAGMRPAEPTVAAASPTVERSVEIPRAPAAPQTFALSTAQSPQTYGEIGPDSRIILRALQDSWVQVRDRQDALLLTRVLRSGDSYHVPNQTGLTLLTGNAGGIEIEVDGVKLPPVGPVGAVRRQIALDPTRLLNGTATTR